MSQDLSPQLMATKQHFKVLDGMRGIAAICVVVYHFMEFVVPDYHDNFIAHGHLAVDFFFCLSGFVIAYAYDSRVKKIGILAFLKLRLIRLHPLVMIGSILGLVTFIFDPFSDLSSMYSNGKTALMFIASCFLIPFPTVPERYFNFFHLNPPTWSLFWEYIANVFYAIILFRLKNKILWILTGIAAILLCIESYQSGYLGVGWGGDNFWGGGTRIFYSFLAGMLVYRLGYIIKSKIAFPVMCILLAAVFLFLFQKPLTLSLTRLLLYFIFLY
ncbi:acyltransferase family protein [Niabella ginsengisoli]|uniref:Acyltransferase n=1 Tax=Niabella ginsengisoli TaxID=522298 RepID=A0ABS9SLC8_9BACT|nr:acyltransferase [Niabella ginsengisoli]MCH5599188.1 acyltransferase [Niabella ginsengisoli]